MIPFQAFPEYFRARLFTFPWIPQVSKEAPSAQTEGGAEGDLAAPIRNAVSADPFATAG